VCVCVCTRVGPMQTRRRHVSHRRRWGCQPRTFWPRAPWAWACRGVRAGAGRVRVWATGPARRASRPPPSAPAQRRRSTGPTPCSTPSMAHRPKGRERERVNQCMCQKEGYVCARKKESMHACICACTRTLCARASAFVSVLEWVHCAAGLGMRADLPHGCIEGGLGGDTGLEHRNAGEEGDEPDAARGVRRGSRRSSSSSPRLGTPCFFIPHLAHRDTAAPHYQGVAGGVKLHTPSGLRQRTCAATTRNSASFICTNADMATNSYETRCTSVRKRVTLWTRGQQPRLPRA
jgi:hypothetical protein